MNDAHTCISRPPRKKRREEKRKVEQANFESHASHDTKRHDPCEKIDFVPCIYEKNEQHVSHGREAQEPLADTNRPFFFSHTSEICTGTLLYCCT